MHLKPIETDYAGVKFRSRLEARWAVFFDAMGIAWEYEKEGYELAHGRYLPDFFLPPGALGWDRSGDTWVEVKGECPTLDEMELLIELSVVTRKRAVLLYGEVPRGPVERMWNCLLIHGTDEISVNQLGLFRCCFEEAFPCISWHEERFKQALKQARSARFEFGQTPQL